MKTLTKKYISLFILYLLMSVPYNLMASEANQTFDFIANLINEIRIDPLGKAETLGYNRDILKATLPWLEDTYPPCERDTFLDIRAAAHNCLFEEMSEPEIFPENNYARIGETGGVLTFFNFLSPDNAAQIVVENIFKQELDPERTSELNILNKNFTRIGVVMDAGKETVGQYIQNAYFITICFGSSQLRSEVQVLTMINQVRSTPSSIITYLGEETSIIELLDNNLTFLSEWFKQYPPLMDNFFLHQSAQKYAKQRLYMASTPSLTLNSDPSIRAYDMGYQGSDVTEFLAARIISPDKSTAIIADAVFSHLAKEELKAAPQRNGIFSNDANECGMGLSFVSDNDQIQIFSSALDTGIAAPGDSGTIRIYGIVYSDIDENNIYSPGEGYASAIITIVRKSDMMITKKIIADLEGHFNTVVESDESYRFEVSIEELSSSMDVQSNQNLFLPIEISRPPEEYTPPLETASETAPLS